MHVRIIGQVERVAIKDVENLGTNFGGLHMPYRGGMKYGKGDGLQSHGLDNPFMNLEEKGFPF